MIVHTPNESNHSENSRTVPPDQVMVREGGERYRPRRAAPPLAGGEIREGGGGKRRDLWRRNLPLSAPVACRCRLLVVKSAVGEGGGASRAGHAGRERPRGIN